MSRNAHPSKRVIKRKSPPVRLESRESLRHDHDLISEPDFHGRESSYRARAEYDNSFRTEDDKEWKNAPNGDLSFEEQYRTDGEEHNYRGPVAENKVGEYPRLPRGLYRRTRSLKNFYGIGPMGYKRSDERIEEELCEALTKDQNINASEITVEVKDAVVKLSGVVEDREDRVEAEMLAHRILGVEDIQNNISVKKRRADLNLH